MMQRLTKRTTHGHVYMDCGACPLENQCVNYSEADKSCMQVVIKRLAEYEDCGMSPAEVRLQMVRKVEVIEAELSDDTIQQIAEGVLKQMRQSFTLRVM